MNDKTDRPNNRPPAPPSAKTPAVRLPTIPLSALRVPVVRTTGLRMPAVRTGPPLEVRAVPKASRLVRYPNASSALRSLLEDGSVKPQRIELKPRTDPKQGLRGDAAEKPSPSERSKPSPNALQLIRESVERPAHDYRLRQTEVSPSPPLPRVEAAQIIDGASLGQMIRIRRQMLKLSQQQLAEQARVGRRFISELEAGKVSVELGRALAVCQALGLILTLQAADGR